MKTLLLIRHAKSEHLPGIADISRSITATGAETAENTARKLEQEIPDDAVFWSSPAKRTAQTVRVFCKVFSRSLADVDFREELYTFSVSGLEHAVRRCDDDISFLTLFGHNEAITEFVNIFGSKTIPNVPTSGAVLLEFDQNSWMAVKKGRTKKVVFPKEI